MLQYFYVIYVLNLLILSIFFVGKIDKTLEQPHMESTYDHRECWLSHRQMLLIVFLHTTEADMLHTSPSIVACKSIFDLAPPCSCLSKLLTVNLIHCSSHTLYRLAQGLHVLNSSN